MRRTFQFFVAAAMATAIGASLYAQGSVPELQFDAVDLLKTPTDKDIFVGEVAGVAANSRGQIFVYNRTGHPYATLGDSRTFYHGGSRLFVFDSNGKYVTEWGQETYGFNAAAGLRIDAQDNVWTADFGANQVVKFDREGRIQLVLGRKPETIGVRSGGGLMAALWSGPVGTATEGGARGAAPEGRGAGAPGAAAGGGRGAGGAGGGGGRGAGAPGAGAPAGAAPPAGAPAGAARGAAPAGAPGGAAPPAGAAGPGGGRGGAAPGSGTPGSGMSRPSDVAWDKQGNIFIADGMGNNDRVAKFDKDGRFILHWGSTGTADGQFEGVKGIAIDAQGNVYVADNGNKRIQVFDSEGKFKSKMTGFGTPQAMCITPGATQYLYVSHWGNNNGMDDAAIYKVSLTGQVVGKFGSAGKLVKEFGLANSLDCRGENELLVGEMANWRVQRVTVKR